MFCRRTSFSVLDAVLQVGLGMYTYLYSVGLRQNHECNEWMHLEEIDRDRSEALACNKKNVLKNERVLSAKVATFLLRLSENIFSSHVQFLIKFTFADVKAEKYFIVVL